VGKICKSASDGTAPGSVINCLRYEALMMVLYEHQTLLGLTHPHVQVKQAEASSSLPE
jgi:hypothetical protein